MSDRIKKIAKELYTCSESHQSNVRLLGNVKASEISELCDYVLRFDEDVKDEVNGMSDKMIKYLERKIELCDELGDMPLEKWAFIQCLQEFRKYNTKQS